MAQIIVSKKGNKFLNHYIIYLSICIYIYIHSHRITYSGSSSGSSSGAPTSPVFDMLQRMANTYFQICLYIQKITLSLILKLKITIHNTKHTKHTKSYFPKSYVFVTNPYFSKIRHLFESALSVHFYGAPSAGLKF